MSITATYTNNPIDPAAGRAIACAIGGADVAPFGRALAHATVYGSQARYGALAAFSVGYLANVIFCDNTGPTEYNPFAR